ncbi:MULTISPECIES: MetQ/NlpA family ABC transporter substrate-binding protein [unclassified Paenibacillus]|uniref:MetQ/NlpA family ABC transporter substrate-binding protein n=1 Tax=unclassified Paenibacillus TaxID=185978 RepID=UPI0008957E9C|nr:MULTISPECIES: MetQ/NlpA family ABC transporter substrate-binding protein [unclassified Paenibacillus]OMC64814.1 methionine ABC transporter substrate-binding protein [Paenibacillus sp. FSL H7-0326]SDX49855.1 D-methionine transport system substrate-binding protein [Paenibacillus sp. PDC88]
MKKWFLSALTLTLVLVLAACGNDSAPDTTGSEGTGGTEETVTLKVGATPVPQAEILEQVKPILEEQGVNLEIVTFNDYVQPNVQLDEGQLDANFFQHKPYLDNEIETRGLKLAALNPVHVEPLGAYSNTITSADELQDGAKIAIPNDATNGGRALILLDKNGIIKLKDNTNIESKISDIAENPKNLEIIEMDAAMLPRQLGEVELAVINVNYALEADLNPLEDALFLEDADSPYANLLVSREDNKDNEAIQKLNDALQSDEIKQFIEDNYAGSIVPAF